MGSAAFTCFPRPFQDTVCSRIFTLRIAVQRRLPTLFPKPTHVSHHYETQPHPLTRGPWQNRQVPSARQH